MAPFHALLVGADNVTAEGPLYGQYVFYLRDIETVAAGIQHQMIEARFHGRGGQGAVVASELLAQAAFLEGKYPQSFPFFGVERRGAPVTAFIRINSRPIAVRTGIAQPDIVVVFDEGLVAAGNAMAGLKSDGLLLVNSTSPPERWGTAFPGSIATVDATRIALAQNLGSRSSPLVNTAMLGALARASGIVTFSSIIQAIMRFVPARAQANSMAAMAAYRGVEVRKVVVH
jgi:2-oxoacid:acceptor oxidoreductase gamma subunit (pyruvate/2-ketoisovalerate family)